MMEIMEGAPATWNTLLTTQLYRNRVEFQQAIRFHEDTLMKLDSFRRGINDSYRSDDEQFRDRENPRNARVNAVGWNGKIDPPKDNTNILKRATPASKGDRPCPHCRSGNHWYPECKHSFRGNHFA
jgi:hypothetical protein